MKLERTIRGRELVGLDRYRPIAPRVPDDVVAHDCIACGSKKTDPRVVSPLIIGANV